MKADRIILTVNGREMYFTEKKLVTILEGYYSDKKVDDEEVEKPVEGKWFTVNPASIDRNLFIQRRVDSDQEEVRKIVNGALAEAKKFPGLYKRAFKTLIPERKMESASIYSLKRYAVKLGGRMATWVDQGLEWAHRISNGETWESLCNEPDISKNMRIVEWMDCYMGIGGARYEDDKLVSGLPCTHITYVSRFKKTIVKNAVPLVVKFN